MQETVEIPERITHCQFGCKQSFFEEHVQGKCLNVVSCHCKFLTVEAGPEKEEFNVHTSDLIACKKDGETGIQIEPQQCAESALLPCHPEGEPQVQSW